MLKKGTPASPETALAMRVLPVPGGPTNKHTLGDARTQRGKFLRFLEKLNHLLELLFGFVIARHIGKSHRWAVAGEHARAALAKAEGLIARALGLAENEEEEGAQQDQRDNRNEDVAPGIPKTGGSSR